MAKSSLKLVVEYLKNSNHSGKIEVNLMVNRAQLNRKNIGSSEIDSIRYNLSLHLKIEVSKDIISSALNIPNVYPEFNPLRELQAKHSRKKAKGFISEYADRVPTYFGSIGETSFNFSAFDTLFKKFYVGMIAGGLPETTQANEIFLIMVGHYGCGKTWWVEKMLPHYLHQYFAKNKLKGDLSDLETTIKMTNNLICFDDEGDYMDEKSNAAIKEILSSREISYRPLYSNVTDQKTRIASFIMTSNLTDHLRDETGNRRLFVIDCDIKDGKLFRSIERNPTKKRLEAENLDRELMVVEALNLIDEGFDFNLTPEEVEEFNDQMLGNHVEGVEHSFVETYFTKHENLEDARVISVLELENYARDKIRGTFNRKFIKIAMEAKGFKRGVHRVPSVDDKKRRLSGYRVSSVSSIFDIYDVT